MRESQAGNGRVAAVIGALLLIATPAQSQIRGGIPARPDPGYWFSGGAAALILNDINDGATQSVWRFGNDPLWQIRGTLEKALDNASTIGVSVGYGRVDLTLSPFTPSVEPIPTQPNLCTSDCTADVQLWTAMAQFRSGGGPGFHTLFELSGGVTGFRDLRTRSDRAPIGPDKAQFDLSGALGAGFGYSLSPDFVVAIVQDFGIGWHSQSDLPEGVGRSWRVRTTRASLRYAFGNRR